MAPPAALLGLALLGVNIVGLSATGEILAERLPLKLGNSSVLRTAVGIAVPEGFIARLWLLGGCFRFFGYIGALLLATTGRSLDALTLGGVAARSLGVYTRKLQWRGVLGIGACVGASVAAAGVVGFVGLIVPHIVRPLTGQRPSALLLPSCWPA